MTSIRFFPLLAIVVIPFLFAHAQIVSPEATDRELEKILKEFFLEDSEKNLIIDKLSGGYSGTSNYKVNGFLNSNAEALGYVLRFHQSEQNQENIDREFYMLVEASRLGIAPHVYGISEDRRAIVTDYIKDKTLPLEQLKQPALIQKIAEAIQQIHTIPKSQYTTITIRDKYESIYKDLTSKNPALEAINLIRYGTLALNNEGPIQKTIHGELHPGNIFITSEKVQFIDWFEATWDDPFYDLSYFSILNNFGNSEEQMLLHFYLGHEPKDSEKKRYDLTKMVNLAGISLTLDRIAYESSNQDFSKNESARDISYYVQIFASGKNDLSSQFFHDWAMSALEAAKKYKKENSL